MPYQHRIHLWKTAPFIRLLLPLIGGIIWQWYLPIILSIIIIMAALFTIFFFSFYKLSFSFRYTYQWGQGVLLHGILFCLGAYLCYSNDIRNDKQWYGKYSTDSSTIVIKILEPPVEKAKTFRTIGSVEAVLVNGHAISTRGKVLLYFAKVDSNKLPQYGQVIIVNDGLQSIKAANNPGGFNYSKYMLFQQTTHQVFVKANQYALVSGSHKNIIMQFVYSIKASIINTLQKYIVGSKKVIGIAEALLIGYKEDLDKDVVQAYSNTGVVHIIAISGMHLGLIYAGLVWLFVRLPFTKQSTLARVIFILSLLWLFTLVTGASASVLRSAVMFTCIIIGKEFFKQASIYNSLATSSFLLLCYNPFLVWDVGFQLSYSAIIGIVWLQKPIENLFYFKNIIGQHIWQMSSITLAATLLTLPICIYYFHQIPTTFLITNLLCVPLSSLILFAEIGLLCTAMVPILAIALGRFVYVLTWCMNTVIDYCSKLPYSLISNIYATPGTTWALYAVLCFLFSALLRKNKGLLKIAAAFFILYIGLFLNGKINCLRQQNMIVYQVSKHTAIDFISKGSYFFYGDDALKTDVALQNYNLTPTRVLMQAKLSNDTLHALKYKASIWQYYNKIIMVVANNYKFIPLAEKINIDVVIFSHNTNTQLADLVLAIQPSIIVFDGSNSMWKIKQWKTQCEYLHLRHFDTNEQGAFVLNAHE